MRLLNAQTRKLEEFFDHQIPVYAILSHTWGANELIYDDITGPTPLPPNVKIDGCCEKALSQKIDYVWIDTLCINKSSSAELSEAINSMFQWYRSASICYAYLSDVSGVPRPELGQNDYQYLSRKGPTSFSASRWFTRSWTLQELLAPEKVQFYDQKWNMIGEKEKSSNHPHLGSGRHFIDDGRGWVKIDRPSLFYLALSRITGIPILVLSGDAELEEVCVAERMSWAADRQTTRKEDIAYSLMGIFGVNMAMLYGEGDRAFIRLQEEIIQRSDDDSIFAWGLGSTNHMSRPSSQLLAFSPTDFKGCQGIRRASFDKPTPHYSLTNKGLLIERPMLILPEPFSSVLMPLACTLRISNNDMDLTETLTKRLALPMTGKVQSNGVLRLDLSSAPTFVEDQCFESYAMAAVGVYISISPRPSALYPWYLFRQGLLKTKFRRMEHTFKPLRIDLGRKWLLKRVEVQELYPTCWYLERGGRFVDLHVDRHHLEPPVASGPVAHQEVLRHVLLRIMLQETKELFNIHLKFRFKISNDAEEPITTEHVGGSIRIEPPLDPLDRSSLARRILHIPRSFLVLVESELQAFPGEDALDCGRVQEFCFTKDELGDNFILKLEFNQ